MTVSWHDSAAAVDGPTIDALGRIAGALYGLDTYKSVSVAARDLQLVLDLLAGLHAQTLEGRELLPFARTARAAVDEADGRTRAIDTWLAAMPEVLSAARKAAG
jgi:hypothetical protein